jgi:3-oxoacyl-[acyl-carrier protein] reductase
MEAEQRTAVVTGSTKGIGRAIALRLARSRFNVVLNYSTDDTQANAAFEACRQVTPRVLLQKADVSQRSAVEGLMRAAVQTFGTLDLLVNNAARVADAPVLQLGDDEWARVVDTNMKGTFLCSQVAARYMIEQEAGGIILNIGAATGLRARKNGINTCASKAGVMLITQCLALELAPKIRVNSIVPGLTLTEEVTHRFNLNDPEVRRTRESTIPLQRIGTPEDVADAVMLLVSQESRFITGQKLHVDGGQYMF